MITSELSKLSDENNILKQQIQSLADNLKKSQEDFSSLSDSNKQLLDQNAKLVDQIAALTCEIISLKQHLLPSKVNAGGLPTNRQTEINKFKRSAIPITADAEKKKKTIDQWLLRAPVIQNNDENPPMNVDTEQIETETNREHNPISNDDNAITESEKVNENGQNEQQIGWRTVQFKKPKSKAINGQKTSNGNSTLSKPPPIQVQIGDGGYMALHIILTRQIGADKFIADHMKTNRAARIFPSDTAAARKIIETIIANGYEFHTFKEKSERNKCFILRGLNGIENADVVRVALIEAGFPAGTRVLRHSTGFQKAHPEIKHNTLYKVVTSNQFDVKKLNEIDAIYGMKIKFENIKGNKVVQCKRCQDYFHTAGSCHRAFKCVKCNDKHEFGHCPKDLNPDLPVRCANCNGAHTANNHRECVYFKFQRKHRTKIKTKIWQTRGEW